MLHTSSKILCYKIFLVYKFYEYVRNISNILMCKMVMILTYFHSDYEKKKKRMVKCCLKCNAHYCYYNRCETLSEFAFKQEATKY